MSCASPIAFERLVDYFAGDLDDDDLEAHLFSCAGCASAAEAVQALGSDIARLVPPVITAAHLTRLRGAGTRICETPVAAGGEVDVYFTPDLDLLVHALHAELTGVSRVDMELFMPGGEALETFEAVPFDPASGTVYVACQRHYKDMGYPDETRFRLVTAERGTRRVLGEYNIRHHWL
jgi:hypothetical protein